MESLYESENLWHIIGISIILVAADTRATKALMEFTGFRLQILFKKKINSGL